MLLNVTYSNTFTPYEHTEVVDCVDPLALNAVLTVYNALDMFSDDVCAAVTNDAVCAVVTNEPVSALVMNDPVSALVKNEPVASLIALIDPVRYSKLPSNSAWVSGEPLVERNVKFAIFY